MSRPQRTRQVNPRTIGGGFDLRDTIQFPEWLWVIIRLSQWWWRHKVSLLATLVILVSATITHFNWFLIARNLLLVALVATIAMYAWIYFRYDHAPTPLRLTVAIQRRWLVRRRWPSAMHVAKMPNVPRLTKIRYTPNGITGFIRTDRGMTSHELSAKAVQLAGMFKAYEFKVSDYVPFEATVSIVWGDPTSRILYPSDISEVQEQKDPSRVAFALDPDHAAVSISLSTSMLIIGETESGKSNCFWSIIAGINEKLIPYKLRVIDPAGGVELSQLENSPNLRNYAQRLIETESLISEAHTHMEERLTWLKEKGERKYTMSEETPLEILVIDELLMMPDYSEKSKLGAILSSGRKAGFIVIAHSQLSQIDALGRIRDLFAQRICHATKNREMTDAALGSGAESSGAYCSKISKSTPGVGYYFSLDTRQYTRFRTPYIQDKDTYVIAAGNVIQNEHTNKRRRILQRKTAVYQFYGTYQGERGRLLYVGIAYDPIERQAQHSRDKEWWHDVDTDLTEIDWYPNKRLAKEQETYLIQNEFPVYNKSEAVPAGQFM